MWLVTVHLKSSLYLLSAGQRQDVTSLRSMSGASMGVCVIGSKQLSAVVNTQRRKITHEARHT